MSKYYSNRKDDTFRYDVAVMTYPGRDGRKAMLQQTIRRIAFETPRNCGIYIFSGVHDKQDGGPGDDEMFEVIEELCDDVNIGTYKVPEGELLFYNDNRIKKGTLAPVCRVEGVLKPPPQQYLDAGQQGNDGVNTNYWNILYTM